MIQTCPSRRSGSVQWRKARTLPRDLDVLLRELHGPRTRQRSDIGRTAACSAGLASMTQTLRIPAAKAQVKNCNRQAARRSADRTPRKSKLPSVCQYSCFRARSAPALAARLAPHVPHALEDGHDRARTAGERRVEAFVVVKADRVHDGADGVAPASGGERRASHLGATRSASRRASHRARRFPFPARQ